MKHLTQSKSLRPSGSAFFLTFCLLLNGNTIDLTATSSGSLNLTYQNRRNYRTVEKGYIKSADGASLYFEKVGKGPDTVMIPGRLWLSEDFRRLAEGRTLIFYDMRNRGLSSSVADGDKISIQHDVEDVETIRKHFKIKKMSLIGYSYLGLMVAMYAMKYPGYVERLVQLGPVPLKFGTKYPDQLTNQRDNPVPDQSKMDELRKLQESGFDKSNPKEFCMKRWEVIRYSLVGDPEKASKLGSGDCEMPNEWPTSLARHFQHHFASVQKLDIPKAELAKINIPVLIFHGTKDRNAPYGSGREWAANLPNARLITIQGAAHRSWVEEPQKVFSPLEVFLNGKFPREAEIIR